MLTIFSQHIAESLATCRRRLRRSLHRGGPA